MHGQVGAAGSLVVKRYRPEQRRVLELMRPNDQNPQDVNNWKEQNEASLQRALEQAEKIAEGRILGLPFFWSELFIAKIDSDGRRVDLGLAGCRVITTVGVNFLVDALQNIVEPELMRFHGIGTGTNAEAVGNTALQTELTTQYNPDNTRATGSLAEGASPNIYRTIGTNTIDAAVNATEHGIFTQAATGGGVLLDRTVFTAVVMASGDSLESTYDLTITAGS